MAEDSLSIWNAFLITGKIFHNHKTDKIAASEIIRAP